MKDTVETDSGAMIYIKNFIKISSQTQKLIREIHKHTDSLGIA
jgi:hypothetical protein